MLYHRNDFPQESELVVCTVTRIQHHTVFVRLDHFNRSAILHISEVSPGRIRNLRDFVQENKVIVCKVLSIREDKGHIDVSLRRVTDNQRINLMSKFKQETKAEKILEDVATECKLDVKKTYDTVFKRLSKDYDFMHQAFMDVVKGDYTLPKLDIDAKAVKLLNEYIALRVKPPQVELSGKFRIVSFANDGANIIRDVLTEANKVDDKLAITYNGGGNYNFRIITGHFLEAEEILKKAQVIVENTFANNKEALYEFIKNDGKQLS